MSQNPNTTPTPQESQDPIIPPALLLGIAALAFLAAFGIAFTQRSSTGQIPITAIAAAAIGIVSLLGWVITAPEQASAALSGRAVRFGGVSVIVTVIFIAALIAVYSVVKTQNLRLDLTQQDTYSLTDAGRETLRALGADPTVPPVKIYAFYGSAQAGRKDRDVLLFDDIQTTSNSKVTYEFIDPERNPLLSEKYSVQNAGQLAVVAVKDGAEDVENAEIISLTTQEQLVNAVIQVVTTGDFRAYFLSVEDGVGLTDSMAQVNNILTSVLGWKAEEISVLDIDSEKVNLLDPIANGSVLVIAGGVSALPDESVALITDFMQKGGDVVLMAGISLEADTESLATADNITNFLMTNYGVSFNRNVVVDVTQQAFDNAIEFFTVEFTSGNKLTQGLDTLGDPIFIFSAAHPIDVAATPPANVNTIEVVKSGEGAYSKPIQALLNNDSLQQDTDPKGPFTLVTMSENTQTGSRLVLIGSQDTGSDRYVPYASNNVQNTLLFLNAMYWASGYDEAASRISPVPRPERPQDTPVNATANQITLFNLITVLALPFGVLGIGALVWSTRRRTAKES